RVRGNDVQLMTRNLIDASARYPELAALGGALHRRGAILDGEVVGFDASGRATFEALQQHAGRSGLVTRQGRLAYIVFDILELDGRSLLREPYTERRRLLEALALEGEHWHTPPYVAGGGEAML